MREVETQPIGLDQRTLLPHVVSQPLPQDVMNQVSGAVIAFDVVTSGRVDGGVQGGWLELLFRTASDYCALRIFANRVDGQPPILGFHCAGIAYLAPGFDVERVFP